MVRYNKIQVFVKKRKQEKNIDERIFNFARSVKKRISSVEDNRILTGGNRQTDRCKKW
jgi:hypothetical protein